MRIKHSISLKIRPSGGRIVSWQIQMDVTYNRQRLRESTGFLLTSREAWDSGTQRVVTEYRGPEGETGEAINYALTMQLLRMESAFCKFEQDGVIPSPDELRNEFRKEIVAASTSSSSGIEARIVLGDIPEDLKNTDVGEWWAKTEHVDVRLPYLPYAEDTLSLLTPGKNILAFRVTRRDVIFDVNTSATAIRLRVDYIGLASTQKQSPLGGEAAKRVTLPQGVTEAMLAKSINDCGFCTRTRNALAANDISHVGVLCSCSEIMISYIRNLGKQGLREIRNYLESNHLGFGMNLRDYGYEKPEWM